MSRRFIEASAAKFQAFEERDLSGQDLVAIFVDGKTFAQDQMVLALGVAVDGTKVVLGFVQTDTENEKVLAAFLRSLVDRGLDLSRSVLVVIDGSKGLRAPVRQASRKSWAISSANRPSLKNLTTFLTTFSSAMFSRRQLAAHP